MFVAALAACASGHALTPLPNNPTPAYPASLRDSGLSGVVVVKMRVDRTGAVIPSSLVVVSATDSAFTAEVRRVIPEWRFARRSGDTTEPFVEQRFAFKLHVPTQKECRALIAREGTKALDLPVVESRPLKRDDEKSVSTVAEFLVDTAGRADMTTLRIVQSSLSKEEARADLEQFLPDWRFAPANAGGCIHAATARHQFDY